MALPANASAEDIRKHFAEILVKEYSMSQDYAEYYVKKWLYGKRKEIREFDIETYRQIFGPEVGSILHGHRFSYGPQHSKNGLEDWQAGMGKPESYLLVSGICTCFGLSLLYLAWQLRPSIIGVGSLGALGVVVLMAAVGFYEKIAIGKKERERAALAEKELEKKTSSKVSPES